MYFFYFYPLGLDRRRDSRPVLTWVLMALMSVSFVWIKYYPQLIAFSPWDLVFFPGSGKPWTVSTSIFMHAGWLHLLGNLVYFHVFGPPLEDRLGRWKFGLYFFLLGNFGNLVHGAITALGLLGQQGLGVMGASGAIAGMLGFSLVRFYDARVAVAWWVLAPLQGQNKVGKTFVPLAVAVGLWMGLQVVQATLVGETGTGVSFGAHFGGFAMGLALALGMGELREGKAEAARARARRYFQAGQYHASAGAWSEFLDQKPQDLSARRALARVHRLNGQHVRSAALFRQALRGFLDAGQLDVAVATYDEALRAELNLELEPGEMTRLAVAKEKQLDHRGALDLYRLLYEEHPRHPLGQRALVRVVVLCNGKVGDAGAAQRWLEEAMDKLPEGTWRDYLASEFDLAAPVTVAAGPGAAPRSAPV